MNTTKTSIVFRSCVNRRNSSKSKSSSLKKRISLSFAKRPAHYDTASFIHSYIALIERIVDILNLPKFDIFLKLLRLVFNFFMKDAKRDHVVQLKNRITKQIQHFAIMPHMIEKGRIASAKVNVTSCIPSDVITPSAPKSYVTAMTVPPASGPKSG